MNDEQLPPIRRLRLVRFRRHSPTQIPPFLGDDLEQNLTPTDGNTADDFPHPDDFAPSPPRPIGPLSRAPSFQRIHPALQGFVLFFVMSALQFQATGTGFAASGERIFNKHEWWRLLSALFVHADLGHLLANSPLYLIFGWYLYAFFGPLAFPLGALLIGMASNLATVYFYDPKQQLMGASGMLYGMIALWLIFYVKHERIYPVPKRIFRATGFSLLLLFPTTFQESTSYLAHFFGFLLGLSYGLAIAPFIKVRSDI